MRRAATALLTIIGIVGLSFFTMGFYSQTGKAPGLVSGQLAPCPNKPNCVNSESAPGDEHAISPLKPASGADSAAFEQAKGAIENMGGQVKVNEAGYLAAEFTSDFFGFVDDLELRLDTNNGLIHVRSASRTGYSDFGVNRKRVEALRAKLAVPSSKS